MGNLEGALEDFHKGIEIDPGMLELYMKLVETYYDLGDLDETIAALDQAYELNPEDPWIRTWKAIILWDQYHDQAGALENLAIAIANQGEYPHPWPDDVRGSIYNQTGQYELCISNYEEIVILVPDNPWSLYLRGSCYRNIGEHDAARQDFEIFLDLTDGDPDAEENRKEVESYLINLN